MYGVWEHNHVRRFWEVLKPNHSDLMTSDDFRMIKPTFEMLCTEISPVINHIHCWKEFLLRIEGFIR